MADHICIDNQLLRDSGRKLGRILDALKNAGEDKKLDHRTLGHKDLVNVMDDFVDNWKIHRKGLTEALTGQQKLVAEASRGYDQIESDLSSAVSPQGPAKAQPTQAAVR